MAASPLRRRVLAFLAAALLLAVALLAGCAGFFAPGSSVPADAFAADPAAEPAPEPASDPAAATPPSAGALQVAGGRLCAADGRAVRLHGCPPAAWHGSRSM